MARLTSTKARKIVRDGKIGGKKLTDKQDRFFRARAGGQPTKKKQVRPKKGRRG